MITTVTAQAAMNRKDRLFESTVTGPGDFVFDQRVVSVFPDMINRSVPGYGTIVPMIGMLARRYAQDLSLIHISEPTRLWSGSRMAS